MANNHNVKQGDGATIVVRSTDNAGVITPHIAVSASDGTPLAVGPGTATSTTLRTTMSSDGPLVTAIGTQSDSAATTDTGTFSLIALFKRALQALTTGNTNTAAVRDRLVPVLTFDRSIGTVVSRAAKTSGGQVYSVSVQSLSSNLRYFQLFNAATAPGGGEVPFASWALYPNSGNGGGTLLLDTVFFGGAGITLSAGVAWGISSTATTYTAGAATDAIVIVGYL